MISKARIKFVHTLEQKKARIREQLFVAEGPKVVGDLMARFLPKMLFHTADWQTPLENTDAVEVNEIVSEEELKKLSFLQHPQQVLAVFPLPHTETANMELPSQQLCLALDGVQDPGNVGTIIRVADWFGITQIYCSHETADVYNPKVVQATMGSLARVDVQYTDLTTLIDNLPESSPVYGTLLDGSDLYQQELSDHGLIVMGNEGKGLTVEVRQRVNHRLLIPNYPKGRDTAESLNVAIATAIVCAEFRRRIE